MTTTVVNVRRTFDYDVYVGRKFAASPATKLGSDGRFGNPFTAKSRPRVVLTFIEYFLHRVETDPTFVVEVSTLKDKRLGCWCAPARCHADVYVAWLEGGQDAVLALQKELRDRL